MSIAARLDRLPPSRYIRNLVLRIAVGGWFELYDLFMVAYISLGLIKDGLFRATASNPFDLTAFAGFAACGFAGMFVGTLIFGGISDRFGRKATFTYSLLWYSAANLLMAFAHGPLAIDAWRAIAGIGIGVQLITIDTYISELTPKDYRGRAIALSQFVGYFAIPAAALFAYLLVPHKFFGLSGWRFVAAIGSLGAIAIWFIRTGLPDSPRWHEAHGRAAQAQAQMDVIERAVREEGRELLPPLPANLQPQVRGTLAQIWRPPLRERTILLVIFNLVQTVGYYGFATWVPILLAKNGVTVTHSALYVFLIAIVSPLGPLVAMRYADKWERKWQIVALSFCIAAAGLIFAAVRLPFLIVFFGMCITVGNGLFSVSQHAYQAELFPTSVRARAVGFVYSWSRFSSIFVGFAIAWTLARHGTVGVFVLLATAWLIVAAAVGIFGPRTNRLSLEELSPGQ